MAQMQHQIVDWASPNNHLPTVQEALSLSYQVTSLENVNLETRFLELDFRHYGNFKRIIMARFQLLSVRERECVRFALSGSLLEHHLRLFSNAIWINTQLSQLCC